MLTRFRHGFWSLLLALACAAAPVRAALPDTVERVLPSVVGVGSAYPLRTPTGGRTPSTLSGSGFAISDAGRHLIVTNAHVVARELDAQRGEQIAVFAGRGADAEQRFARVLARDELHDLALLSYAGPPLPSLTLAADDRVRPGEAVAFTGFPIGAALGLFAATSAGIVSAITPVARVADRGAELTPLQIRRLRNPFHVYQLDAIAYPGNSGSALYRADSGEVIGVINSVFVKESREALLSRPSGITYAIPVTHVRKLLRDLSESSR